MLPRPTATDAGYPNGFKTTLIVGATGVSSEVAQALQAYFAAAGIQAALSYPQTTAWSNYLTGGTWHNGLLFGHAGIIKSQLRMEPDLFRRQRLVCQHEKTRRIRGGLQSLVGHTSTGPGPTLTDMAFSCQAQSLACGVRSSTKFSKSVKPRTNRRALVVGALRQSVVLRPLPVMQVTVSSSGWMRPCA